MKKKLMKIIIVIVGWIKKTTVTYSMYNRTDEVDVIRKQIV